MHNVNLTAGRDVGSIFNLGARHFQGTFFFKEKGECFENRKGILLLIAKSLRASVPQCQPHGSSFIAAGQWRRNCRGEGREDIPATPLSQSGDKKVRLSRFGLLTQTLKDAVVLCCNPPTWQLEQ